MIRIESSNILSRQGENHEIFSTVIISLLLIQEGQLSVSRMGIFVCVEALWPSQPNGVMSSVVSLPNHTFTGQA